MTPLLEIRDLQVDLHTRRGDLRAIDGLSFSVSEGETVALIGESGCGKSLTALAIMGLLPTPPAELSGGSILYNENDIAKLPEKGMQAIRGRRISMIFQDPMSALNPVMTIGRQISEGLQRHFRLSAADARTRAIELLDTVRIPSPEARFDAYPHQLSGGMNQRVVIAAAIACEPDLLIADEPTTALDVTIQSQILELLRDIQARTGMGMIFITHDLGVVAEMADRAVVMYGGRKMEEAGIFDLFEKPRHPYTRGLLGSTPRPGDAPATRLTEITGSVPGLGDLPRGCVFSNRCASAFERCAASRPALTRVDATTEAACFLVEEETPA
ncbi:MAG: ABC transporter ATP-binding protein [Pseudomonadota bacterium]|nr:ABC transporter ATP-binding protein [Pseudomonadota bacterium]